MSQDIHAYNTFYQSPDKLIRPEDLTPAERRASRDWEQEYQRPPRESGRPRPETNLDELYFD
jgi:hypothetical protein